jgi:hypothetical protein
MQLSFAFLAKNADFGPDGTLSVIGADIAVLSAEHFPHFAESLVFVAKIGFSAVECEQTHQFTIDIHSPSGQKLSEESSILLSANPPAQPSAVSYVGVIANFEGAAFPSVGAYTFVANLDGEEIKRLVLYMVANTRPQTIGA